ncbi:type I polyketide synthase [Nocardia brasiliensis]|uniref:type I polyketide synthase n=1 Tax=Nocardia brasiliensis TaxID=37326 RepID=UPI002B4AEDB0|nr:beta-ketoacyl synthase N-terminal-like domain-containing protein [Nocardia brasiliensis]
MSAEMARRTADEISMFLTETLSELLDIASDDVALSEPFSSFGLTSAVALVFVGKISTWMGKPLPPDLPWEYPTVHALAEGLAAAQDGPVPLPQDSAEPVPVATARPHTGQEPVAIIGIGCAYAGLRGPEQLWETLWHGKELVGKAPRNRYDRTQAAAGADAPDDHRTPWFGSFLDDPYAFDANYFGISDAEAAVMDPQQRLLAETVADAFEDAGVPIERLAGTATGAFVGITAGEYARGVGHDPHAGLPIAAVTGNAASIAANRLSYQYDLRGPSVSVDTACSSSLVALHLALRSLHDGDCDVAVVGGVNLTLDPHITAALAEAGMMAADGRCKTFDDRADGYVRGEGSAAVVLKPLAQAERDGDRVYAVLLGSAVNQDGRTNGLTAPSFQSQVDVLRRAYRRAGVDPRDVQYVEAHGTGTILGDAIEARALGAVFGEKRTGTGEFLVGSAKTVVGHLEAAAGITGLVKTALALHHGQVPANLNFESPSKHIAFADLPFEVPTTSRDWPAHGGRALAGVSSFGFGGTNAHAVLTGAPAGPVRTPPPVQPEKPYLVSISARSEQSTLAQVDSWLALLRDGSAPPVAELAQTSTARRAQHPFRIAVPARDHADLADQLAAIAAGSLPLGAAAGRVPRSGPGQVGFVFTGQGNQWVGMGRKLIRQQPVFRDALLAVDRELRIELGWSTFAVLDRGGDAEALADTGTAQPVLFALQIALAALWRSWGIVPAAVVGHSVGEIAAAHVSGALDLRTAAQIIAARAKATARLRDNGCMAVVNLPAAELELPPRVHLAGTNGPKWTLISGHTAAVDGFLARLDAEQVMTRRLPGRYAFHSPLMLDCLPEFVADMPCIQPSSGSIAFYSTVTGDRIDGTQLNGLYWSDQVVRPVEFAAAVGAMIEANVSSFIEIGPHPALNGMLKSLLRHHDRPGIAVPSLVRDIDDLSVLLAAVGELHVRGHEIRWAGVDPVHRPAARLPLYPYDRKSYRVVDGVPSIESTPATRATELFAADADYVAPRTEYEQVVAEMWAELLGLEQVGVFENFFRIGGHSLAATQFVRRLRELFEIEFALRRMLLEPTVAQVAAALEELMVEQADALLETAHELTS